MEINIEELEFCKINVHYTADPEEIMNKRSQIHDTFIKAPVKGFRKGKAPLDAIKLYYRSQIDDALKRALSEDAYHNTIFEKKLRPHGPPKFNSASLDGGKFVCKFEMLTKPDFEVADYTHLQIPKPAEPISSDEMTEKILQELRVKFGDVQPFSETDFVQATDNLLIDYEGSVNNEVIDSLTATGQMLRVGNNDIVGFDDNLLGMMIGDVREFNVLIPLGGLSSIAGKTVNFKVTLVAGTKSTPCPLNDELAKNMGRETFEELRSFVAATAAARVANHAKMALNEAIANHMINDNDFTVPQWMKLSEAQYLAYQSKLDWATMLDDDKERFLDLATKSVKLALILDKVREDEPEAQLSDQEVFEVIKQNLAKTQDPQNLDNVIMGMQKTGYLQMLFSRIKDEFTMDFITKKIKIIE